MSKTVINACNCEHSYQDITYGKSMRVCNVSGSDENKCTCTVCGTAIKVKSYTKTTTKS